VIENNFRQDDSRQLTKHTQSYERTRQPTNTTHSPTPATTQKSKTPQTKTPYSQPGTYRRITLTYKTSTPDECRWATHPHTRLKTPHLHRSHQNYMLFIKKKL
jgi:hypothetical protein